MLETQSWIIWPPDRGGFDAIKSALHGITAATPSTHQSGPAPCRRFWTSSVTILSWPTMLGLISVLCGTRATLLAQYGRCGPCPGSGKVAWLPAGQYRAVPCRIRRLRSLGARCDQTQTGTLDAAIALSAARRRVSSAVLARLILFHSRTSARPLPSAEYSTELFHQSLTSMRSERNRAHFSTRFSMSTPRTWSTRSIRSSPTPQR